MGQAVPNVMSTMPSYPNPTRRPRLRLLVEFFVLLLVTVLLLRTWYVEGLLVPCRVTSGSMAETLLGPHREVTCRDCGHHFVCGADVQPVSTGATCPNCGCADNDLAAQPDLTGDLLLIDKSAFHLRPPRRWEVVAFRRPQQADKIHVKRVVGLPGESIQIRDGDVYVEGRLQRKTLVQQRAMAILVHDANSRPKLDPNPPDRWRGKNKDSEWASAAGRFARRSTPGDDEVDLLEYRHWCREPGQEGVFSECPITDLCGYNQTRPRRHENIHPVFDLMLSLRLVETWGQGWLNVTATDGQEDFEVLIHPNRNRYESLHNRRPIPTDAARLPPLPPQGDELLLELSLFDRQFLLAFNGRTVITYPYGPSETGKRKPTSRPLAIGARKLGVTIRDLRVYRDVYYTTPIGIEGRWGLDKPLMLGENQYFVLGDNSPISEDSRTWPEGAIPARLLVGKPLLVHFPAKQVALGRWVFQVPDPAKIRYIR